MSWSKKDIGFDLNRGCLMNYFVLIFGVFVFALPSSHAVSNLPTDERMMVYINFITTWTSHEYHGEPLPEIVVIKQSQVQIYSYGPEVVAMSEYKGTPLPTIYAAYDRHDKTIYLSDQIPSDIEGLQELAILHELVHYLQDISGFTASVEGHLACTESEAYDVQYLWQLQNNINLKALPLVQELSLLSAMKCMGNQFKQFK